jgi:hypothetical protein
MDHLAHHRPTSMASHYYYRSWAGESESSFQIVKSPGKLTTTLYSTRQLTSRVGKAYAISDIITVNYFYPLGPDGLTGDVSEVSRPLKEGETMEWVLVSGVGSALSLEV